MLNSTAEPLSAGFWAAFFLGWFVLSVVVRLATQRTLFASPRLDARFVERWVSGRSGTGLVARFATARNCLQVQITPDSLLVQPHFPFTLGFMPEVYDLDKNVPLSAVRSAMLAGGAGSKVVEVTYLDRHKTERMLQLRLHYANEFVAAVSAARPGSPEPAHIP